MTGNLCTNDKLHATVDKCAPLLIFSEILLLERSIPSPMTCFSSHINAIPDVVVAVIVVVDVVVVLTLTPI